MRKGEQEHILARIGSIGKLYWFMPPSANLALREIGIVLFLSVVGLKSGGSFVDTLAHGSGLEWMGYGIFYPYPIIDCWCGCPLVCKNELSQPLRFACRFNDRPACTCFRE